MRRISYFLIAHLIFGKGISYQPAGTTRSDRRQGKNFRGPADKRREIYCEGLRKRLGLITGFTCIPVSVMVILGWPASFSTSYFVGYCSPSKVFHAE